MHRLRRHAFHAKRLRQQSALHTNNGPHMPWRDHRTAMVPDSDATCQHLVQHIQQEECLSRVALRARSCPNPPHHAAMLQERPPEDSPGPGDYFFAPGFDDSEGPAFTLGRRPKDPAPPDSPGPGEYYRCAGPAPLH